MEHLQQLDIVSTNKWLRILSFSIQQLHPTVGSFKHDFVCTVLKPTTLYRRKIPSCCTDGATLCKDLVLSIC